MEYSASAINNANETGAPPHRKTGKAKLIIAASMGNFLEFFDFTVFSFFVTPIAVLFFKDAPGGNDGLLATLGVFWVGFWARPVGSLVLGSYADRHGRKAALMVTIICMAIGSALIAFAPTYQTMENMFSLGIIAPLLIILGRLFQGFSAGGEIGAATTLLLEAAGPKQRGFFTSWQYATQALSSIVGSLFGATLSYYYSAEEMLGGVWRIPFIFSLLIIPVGLYIRAHIHETWHGTADNKASKDRHPIREIASSWLWPFFLAVFMILPVTIAVYLLVFYTKTYLGLVSPGFSAEKAYLVGGGASVIMFVFALIGGLVADRVQKRKPVALGGLVAMLVGAYVFYGYIDNLPVAFVGLAVAIGSLGMVMTLQTLLVLEACPRHIRATAMAMSYSVGVTVFGGSAQMVVTKLMRLFDNDPLIPFWYLGTAIVAGILAYSFFPEKRYT
ncbi:MAG: Major facilitator family protein [Candidatus Tokpelaia hoelldobleri]|uniref:Major facilitator family protein n=1 Tax=Candidatus Tokpelaia hoelldobleri TaxID=1902579 RepID=A0A1U9JX19_9HYPH|nr:MAG: Major facilitator family protein [Candidatus Tokpelaia hoelldoblerii]